MLELVEGSLQYHCRTRLIANVVPGWLNVRSVAPTESEAKDPPDTETEEEPEMV